MRAANGGQLLFISPAVNNTEVYVRSVDVLYYTLHLKYKISLEELII